MRAQIRIGWTLLVMALRADPVRAVGTIFLTTVSMGSGPLFALGSKWVTDAAAGGDIQRAVVVAIGMAGLLCLLIIAGWSSFQIRTILREKTALLIDERLITTAESIPGIEHHEVPEFHDKLEILRQQAGELGSVLDALVINIGMTAQVVLTGTLLASVSPVLLLLPLFAIPSLVIGAITEKWRQKTQDETAEGIRLAQHFFELGTTAAPGKEIRVFGIGRYLVDRQREVWDDTDRKQTRTLIKGSFYSTAGWLFFSAGYIGAVAYAIRLAVSGGATVGDVVLALSLAGQVSGTVGGVVELARWLMSTLRNAGRFVWLLDHAKIARSIASGTEPTPATLKSGITLENVSFRYPATDTDVITNANLHIPAGSTVAIVGENGAGKSTLCKLLCRFYDPTEGRILVDGVDLKDLDLEGWRERMSAGFQDFAKFEFLARETVGLGHVPDIDSESATDAAMVRAGATDVMDALPSGWETQLGRTFDSGVELSGGQWQKLALGRAMMRQGPLLLLLDEPTAALDAETEHQLFVKYAEASRAAAQQSGAITLLVSHRFSTVRTADLIVVINGSTVEEIGSHADLMSRGGLYAELYELQARAYR